MAAAQPSERRARYAEALLFWAITLVVCAGAGFGSYRYGRSWIGDRLGDDVKPVLTSDQLSSRVTPEAFERNASEPGSDAAEEPPKEAVVEVKASGLDEADKAKLEAEKSGGKTAVEPDESEDSAESDEASTEDDTEPSGEADRPESEPRRTERAASAESGRYVVRAGSFRDRKNAERVRDELRAQGYSPYLTTVVKDNEEYTRVNVGSYDDRDEALKLRGELRGEGYGDAGVSTE
jgi:cell division protein FtsN